MREPDYVPGPGLPAMREPHQVQGQQELHLLRQEGRSDFDTKEETDVRDEYKDMVGTGAALTGWVALLSLVMCAALLVSLVFTLLVLAS